jgi:hypothetical protein
LFGEKWTTVTEIFDVETWKLVWSEDSLSIHDVSLSPDGRKIAFVNGSRLEIRDFSVAPCYDPN